MTVSTIRGGCTESSFLALSSDGVNASILVHSTCVNLRVRPILLVLSFDVFTHQLSSTLGVLVGSLMRACVVVDVALQVITSSLEIQDPSCVIALLLTMPRTRVMTLVLASSSSSSVRLSVCTSP
jgi:hypothetical protein